MTIHSSDPFATPDDQRSPVRRLRGRLPSPVTLWTAAEPASGPAGLTVSSTEIVDGDPGRLLGLLDEESELWEAASAAGRFLVLPLGADDRQLADRFAGLMPAPGGLFANAEWTATEWGPVLAGRAQLGRVPGRRRPGRSAGRCWWRRRSSRSSSGPDEPPLLHYRPLPRPRSHYFGE